MDERRFKFYELRIDRVYHMVKRVLDKIERLEEMEAFIMTELSDAISALQVSVAKNTEVDASAVLLMQGLSETVKKLAEQVANAADVPAALAAVKDFQASLDSSNAALADAVTANTPSA